MASMSPCGVGSLFEWPGGLGRLPPASWNGWDRRTRLGCPPCRFCPPRRHGQDGRAVVLQIVFIIATGWLLGDGQTTLPPSPQGTVADKPDGTGGEKGKSAGFGGHGELAVVIQDRPHRMRLDIYAPIAQRRVAVPLSNADETVVGAAEIAKHGWFPPVVGSASNTVQPLVR